MKGCFVFSVDAETNAWLKQQIQLPVANPVQRSADYEGLPYSILEPDQVKPYQNALPVFDLAVAAGEFSDYQNVEAYDWMQAPEWMNVQEGFFVTRVVGESMNRRIPNGAWCVFRSNPAGTRQNKIVLVEHRDIQDVDSGGHNTIKRYHSEKVFDEEGNWSHGRIVMKPESSLFGYSNIELTEEAAEELKVIGGWVATL